MEFVRVHELLQHYESLSDEMLADHYAHPERLTDEARQAVMLAVKARQLNPLQLQQHRAAADAAKDALDEQQAEASSAWWTAALAIAVVVGLASAILGDGEGSARFVKAAVQAIGTSLLALGLHAIWRAVLRRKRK
jgi:hypothetical protein